MITTDSVINIKKDLKAGVVTSYTTSNVSVFLKHNGEQRRFNASVVINSTATSTGYISFASIPLWGDGSYSVYITAEQDADLDVNGVVLETLGTGYIKKITNVSTLVV